MKNLKHVRPLGPTTYNPQPYHCRYKHGLSWKIQEDSLEYSKYLGFRNAKILAERQFQSGQGGPGTYDIPPEIFQKKSCNTNRNVGFGGKSARFCLRDSHVPPPATYFPDTKTGCKRSARPTFERDGFLDRFRYFQPTYHKPPNLYDTCPRPWKSLTVRGPYDCFTGPRNESTIKGYFGKGSFRTPDHVYVPPSDLEHLLKHSTKRRCGKFWKDERFPDDFISFLSKQFFVCVRDPHYPGPAEYDYQNKKPGKESKYPFNSSKKYPRPTMEWTIYPGVGRYNPKDPQCSIRMGRMGSWMFKSKVERDVFPIETYNAF